MELQCYCLQALRQRQSNLCTGPHRPGGFQEVGAPRFQDNRYVNVISPTHRPLLSSRKFPWYSFLLQAEFSPGPKSTWKDFVNEKFQ